ncbi:AMP-binding protein [Nocardia nova]|uniref:AMP-binding protein n=1 Tax=Nocardia nova TaxID=37330 RepID=UPI0027388DEA|nr:AMP-binding protein [Nocardia nova]
MTGLLDWLAYDGEERGWTIADNGDWRRVAYPRLSEQVRRVAAACIEAGVRPGAVVSIVESAPERFMTNFFGVLAAGATPNPLAPPLPLQNESAYRQQLSALLAAAAPSAIIVAEELAGVVHPVLESVGGVTIVGTSNATPAVTELPGCAPDRIGLLQFTSGSSGSPKAVRVSVANLEANCAAIDRWLEFRPTDRIATWLPPYHDMGLIGCIITPTILNLDIQAMTPIDFIRDPLSWLSCFGRDGATITATPNFALAYLLRKMTDEALAGMDFDPWRVMIVGAERIDPAILRGFAERLAPYGFDSRTPCPAYGLAEGTLAVSGLRPSEPVQAAAVTPETGAVDGPFELMSAPLEDGRRWLVGCGAPLDGVTVRTAATDEYAGAPGELIVGGPSVAREYQTAEGTRDLSRAEDGALATGDAGLLVGGQLFPIGRVGDAVKVRGRTIYAEDIEAAVVEAFGVPANRVVALAGNAFGAARVAVLVEDKPVEAVRLRQVLAGQLGTDTSLRLFIGDRGLIARTTSGKPRRRVMWNQLLQGEFDALERS